MTTNTKFKGVVYQTKSANNPNRRWGAQIYANQRRVWLGTFGTEKEAAMAYDSAAVKVRSRDCPRNFPINRFTMHEAIFQSRLTVEEVFKKIRDGSYFPEFERFLRSERLLGPGTRHVSLGLGPTRVGTGEGFLSRLMFGKELTPSDVGSLNRLVIPKNNATKYLPRLASDHSDNLGPDSMQLAFYDGMMRLWKFRYCYWRSSQSYVFTKGWNRFVKEMELKKRDVVSFHFCEFSGGPRAGERFSMIRVTPGGEVRVTPDDDRSPPAEAVAFCSPRRLQEALTNTRVARDDHKGKGIRLFGIDIRSSEINT